MNMEANTEAFENLNEVLVLGTNERLIREVGEKTKGLVISDTKTFESVKKARTEMVTVRTSIDKARKIANQTHRDAISENDDQASVLKVIASEYEQPLQDQVKKWEGKKAEEKRINEQKEEARIAVYISAITDFRNLPIYNVDASIEKIQSVIDQCLSIEISEETYEEYAIEAQQVLNQTIASLTNTLNAAKEHEAESKRQAAAQLVLDETQKKLDEQREEQDKKARERQAEQDAEALQLKNDRKEFERQKKEVSDKVESDRLEAKRKELDIELEAKRLQNEKDEQIRQEALRPDKEKLFVFAGELDNILTPAVESEEARTVIVMAKRALATLANNIVKSCDVL